MFECHVFSVWAAALPDGAFDHGLNGGLIRNIDRQEHGPPPQPGNLPGQPFRLLAESEVIHRDIGALPSERERRRSPDPRRGPGDERYLACKFHRRASSLLA